MRLDFEHSVHTRLKAFSLRTGLRLLLAAAALMVPALMLAGGLSPEAAAATTTVDSVSSQIKFGGSWSTVTDSSDLGGSESQSSTKDAAATFAFSSTRLDVVYGSGPKRGILNIAIDGKAVGTI